MPYIEQYTLHMCSILKWKLHEAFCFVPYSTCIFKSAKYTCTLEVIAGAILSNCVRDILTRTEEEVLRYLKK